MRLRQIEDFLAVVESGGIRAAARKRGVSQPAITRSIRSLETDLGAHLVQRTPQGVLLTHSGRAFFARVRAAHSELRRAEAEAATAGSGESVSIGAGPTAGVLLFPEAVSPFRRQFPRARIRMVEGTGQHLAPLVRDGTLDFAISSREHVKADPALTFKPLFTHQLVVAARKGHPLRNARSLRDLADAEWLSLFPEDFEPEQVKRMFAQAGLAMPRYVIQCESYRFLIALIGQSNMLGIMTGRLLAKAFAGDALEAIPVMERIPSYTTHLITRAGIPLSRPATLMAKLVLQAGRRLAKAA